MAAPKKDSKNRWGFFSGVVALLGTVPQATTAQKIALAAMALVCVMFVALGTLGSVALPAWAVITAFVLATLSIFSLAAYLLLVERAVVARLRCRHVPVYPPPAAIGPPIRDALEEIRRDAVTQLGTAVGGLPDAHIRANIFMLAKIQGGQSDGKWKLVIPDEFAINMNHPAERQLQFAVGQGATGVAYRDGTYQLTRRQKNRKGTWDVKYQMTPELEAQVESRLKWIITFPLIKPNTTSEPVGVLNIDGLTDIADDDILNKLATSVREKVAVVAKTLALQPGICVGIDELGAM